MRTGLTMRALRAVLAELGGRAIPRIMASIARIVTEIVIRVHTGRRALVLASQQEHKQTN